MSRVGDRVTARPVLLLSAVAAVLAAACGGAAPEAQAPRADHEPSTVEEAQAQIARAQAELSPADSTKTISGASADAPPPPPPPPSQPAPAQEPRPDGKKSESAAPASAEAVSQCTSPCRALASMRRAVVALCRMTGDDDTRCRDAKKTLQSSEARITPCSC